MNTNVSNNDLTRALMELFYSNEVSYEYVKLYLIFLYKKNFHSDLDHVYQEIISYVINNTLHIEMISDKQIRKITIIMNTLILGRFILSDSLSFLSYCT